MQVAPASVAQAMGGDPTRALAAPRQALQRKLLDGLRWRNHGAGMRDEGIVDVRADSNPQRLALRGTGPVTPTAGSSGVHDFR